MFFFCCLFMHRARLSLASLDASKRRTGRRRGRRCGRCLLLWLLVLFVVAYFCEQSHLNHTFGMFCDDSTTRRSQFYIIVISRMWSWWKWAFNNLWMCVRTFECGWLCVVIVVGFDMRRDSRCDWLCTREFQGCPPPVGTDRTQWRRCGRVINVGSVESHQPGYQRYARSFSFVWWAVVWSDDGEGKCFK